MKTPIKFIYIVKCLFLVTLSIGFVSCQNECYLQELYLIENKTDKEFLVNFEYSIFTYEVDIRKNVILAKNDSEHILYNNISIRANDDVGTGYFSILIYDRKDSVFFKIDRNEIDRCFCDYASVKVEKIEGNTPLIRNSYKVIVNDSLVSKMTKDTHLTDSIFGLNASQ